MYACVHAGANAHSGSEDGIMVMLWAGRCMVYESGHSPRSSARIKSKCIYTFALLICLHCVHRDDLGHTCPFLKYNPITSHEDFPFPLII